MVAAVALPCVADDDYNWQGDPTLRWQPMFVTHIEQKMNVFNATWDGSNESLSQEHTYDRLVFKHRATPVTLVDGRFVLDEGGQYGLPLFVTQISQVKNRVAVLLHEGAGIGRIGGIFELLLVIFFGQHSAERNALFLHGHGLSE